MRRFTIGSVTARMGWMMGATLMLALSYGWAETRTWSAASGETLEARYVTTTIRNEVVLEKEGGKQIKVPLKELSSNDVAYVALRHPPDLSIEFGDSSKIDTLENSDLWQDNPTVIEEVVSFNVRVKQLNTKDYPFGLRVEYYAVGYQYLDHDKYVLLEKGGEDFSLTYENKRAVKFETESTMLPLEFTLMGNHYGLKYTNYLVLVYDQRGEIIAHEESRKWLYEQRDNLRKLPKGAFFDKTGIRRHATGPRRYY